MELRNIIEIIKVSNITREDKKKVYEFINRQDKTINSVSMVVLRDEETGNPPPVVLQESSQNNQLNQSTIINIEEAESSGNRNSVGGPPDDTVSRMLMKPECFDGTPSKARKWMENFRYCSAVNKWNEYVACRRLPAYLVGSARNWYTSEIADIEASKNLSSLEKLFNEQYVPRTEKHEIRRELNARKQVQGEYVGKFITDVNKLNSEYNQNMSEEESIVLSTSC